MSPTSGTPSEAMMRRRQQQRDETANAGSSAIIAAVDVPVPSTEDLTIVGQELLPASEALVGQGGESSETPLPNPGLKSGCYQTPDGVRSGMAGAEERMSRSSKPKAIMDKEKIGEESDRRMNHPNGPPVSFQPQSPVLPLFTEEQLEKVKALEQSAPMLTPLDHGGGGFRHVHKGYGKGYPPGWGEPAYYAEEALARMRQEQDVREWRMKTEMAQMMLSMGVQLRASQAENQRLRSELEGMMEVRRGPSSNYGTPEEKSTVMKGRNEDGARARQEDLEAEEDGAEARQESDVEAQTSQ